MAKNTGARIVSTDSVRKSAELLFSDDVTAEIAMSRMERFTKPGRPPHVQPATIHEDLLRRDFTVNSIALSLHPASRGLLLDPANGHADLERRELQSNSNYSFYDDPVRLLRLIRLRVRLGFTVHERTQRQYENARSAGIESYIPPQTLFLELKQTAQELNGGEVLAELEREKLVHLFSPALAGSKLNLAVLARLHRAREMIPFGVDLRFDSLGLFLYFMTEKLTPEEKTALARRLVMSREEVYAWRMLERKSRKIEKELKSERLHRPSQVYEALRQVPGEQILFLYLHSPERLVHDRIRNYLQKHLLTAQEVSDKDVVAAGSEPGSPKFLKAKEEMIAARLDGRTWKPAPEQPPARPKATPAGKRATKKTVKPAAKKTAKPAAKPRGKSKADKTAKPAGKPAAGTRKKK